MYSPGKLVLALTLAIWGFSGCRSTSAPTSPPAPTAAAADLYATVRTVVTTRNSGAFTHRSTVDLDDGLVTVTQDGVYDLKADAWTLREDYAYDSPSYRRNMPADPANLTARLLSRDGKGYLSMPSWPTEQRGRWLQVAGPGAVPLPDAPAFGGIRSTETDFLAAFMALEPTGLTHFGTGWTLTGRVDTDVAIQVLGLTNDFRREHVNLAELTGSGRVSIEVTPNGTPTGLKIEGSSVTVTSPLSDDLRTTLQVARGTVLLRDLGDPVRIAAPHGHRVIDPAEMGDPGTDAVTASHQGSPVDPGLPSPQGEVAGRVVAQHELGHRPVLQIETVL
jgi:hypothetical protein